MSKHSKEYMELIAEANKHYELKVKYGFPPYDSFEYRQMMEEVNKPVCVKYKYADDDLKPVQRSWWSRFCTKFKEILHKG